MGEQRRRSNPESVPSPAAALEPRGTVPAGFDRLRTRLLDLTNSNRLLNFRHFEETSLRIVDVDLNAVFTQLTNRVAMRFEPVSRPERTSAVDASSHDSVVDVATGWGWETDYELSRTTSRPTEDALPVLLFPEDLERRLQTIDSAVRHVNEESGSQVLYLIFGFLEWCESDDARLSRLAPLVALPVVLHRAKDRAGEWTLEFSGERPSTNLSLLHTVHSDAGLDVPMLENDDTPESYFARLTPILHDKRRWRLRRFLSLGFLDFSRLVMFSDLDPAKWPGLASHPRLRDLLETRPRETTAIGEDYDLDAAHIKHDVPQVIADADSAQHRVLVDAMRGRNVVIDGPPGTGKSQTITNLIAATLAVGKTVLFVSENVTALDVVRRRLHARGLGTFCLELHGRTRAEALFEDLEGRITDAPTFRGSRGWQRCQDSLQESKRRLSSYDSIMTAEVGSLDLTVAEVLWARERALQNLPFDSALVEDARFPAAVRYTSTDLARTEEILTAHGEHLGRVLALSAAVSDHPWSWLDDELGPESQRVLCILLQDLQRSLKEAVQVEQDLEAIGVEFPATFEGFTLAGSLAFSLPEPDGAHASDLVARCRDDQLRSTLFELVDAARRAQGTYAILAGATSGGDPTRLLTAGISELLMWAVSTLDARGLNAGDIDSLRTMLAHGRAKENTLAKIEEAFTAVTTLLGVNVPFAVDAVPLLLNGVRALNDAPEHSLHLRSPSLESDGSDRIIQQAAGRASELKRKHRELDETLDISTLRSSDSERLRQHATALESSWPWQRSLSTDFTKARQQYEALARSEVKASRQEMADQLRSAGDYLDARARLELDPWCQQSMGPHFAGVETAWYEWQALANWYREVFELLPDDDACSIAVRDVLFHSSSEQLLIAGSGLPMHQVHLDTLSAFAKLLRERPSDEAQRPLSAIVADISREHRDQDGCVEEILTCLLAANLRADLALSSIASVADAVETHRANVSQLDSYAHVRDQIGVDLWNMHTDLAPVERAARFAESIWTSALPQGAVDRLISEDWQPRLDSLRTCLERAAHVSSELAVCRQAVLSCAPSFAACESASPSLGVVAERVSHSLDHQTSLADWIDFTRSRAEVTAQGLAWVSDRAQSGAIAAEHLVEAFRFVFFNTLSLHSLAEIREPQELSAKAQEEARQQFVDADRDAMRLFSVDVAERIDNILVPKGVSTGPAEEWTELALIEHELAKPQRDMSIRRLLERSGSALQALKPCFMMSPASVAGYLKPGAVQFDLVVFDEASQIAPEEALGAIMRGTQLIVAGDAEQLPPVDVFDRVELDAAEAWLDEELVVEEGDSIFTTAARAYRPVRRLRTHYRSIHPDLIAFLSRELYSGDLVVWPPARLDAADLGLRYHDIPYGTCDHRRNGAEAEVVVRAVVEQLRLRPTESLGVIALTSAQQELIEELLDMRLASDPPVADAFKRMQTSVEPFFVRNLSRVQGDERDVIFVSTTYGADSNGNLPQRFGHISGPSGHRYVNVLFTRARKRTEVFCSLDLDRIPADLAGPRGVQAFKQYLTEARDLVAGTGSDFEKRPSTEFAQAVAAVLEQRGFDVAADVGAEGVRVDLAVRRPGDPATFILGIECGEVRERSSGSARDRYRLRQQLLHSRGWTLHRISSAEWFWNRNAEIERLMTRLTGLVAEQPTEDLSGQAH